MTSSDPRLSAESCDLIERLRNPMWAHGNVPFLSPQLEQEENLAAMNEAAAEIERLRDKLSFAEFEWNRATAGMKKRDAKIASLTGAPAQPTVGSIYDAVYRANGSTLNDGEAVREAIACKVASQPSPAATVETGSMSAQWTYDPEARAYYFAPKQASQPPYNTREVKAIIDIANDGTLAGVELIEMDGSVLPPPPIGKIEWKPLERSSAGSDAANALAKRLHHAAVTMQNDDISEPQSEKRRRHIERYETLIDAVDYLSAQPQAAPVTDEELFVLAASAWQSQTSHPWYTDALEAAVYAVRERLEATSSMTRPVSR